ncbi:hypothetical protein [Nonomuraea sp. NPDC046570]|uniref:hypothetical protein n=1 Tax=Nonomuraea sp. NPDC046570 TaxID=3155255 RepID=UPI0033C637A1
MNAYHLLLDPAAGQDVRARRIVVPDGAPLDLVATAIMAVFDEDAECAAVTLVVRGLPSGAVSRARFAQLVGAIGVHRGDGAVGAGDGGTLPGPPNRFELFTYTCTACDARVYRLEADRQPPDCAVAAHGAMELQP